MINKNLIIKISLYFFIAALILVVLIKFLPERRKYEKVVYVVVKSVDPEFEFWQTVKMGAETAAKELDIDMIFTGPMEETDITGQIEILDDIISKRPMAIVLAPSDYKKLVPISEKIIKSNITLVTIDSAIDTPLCKSLISTNNLEAAQQAAEEMARLIGYEGKVAIMSFVKGVSTAIERERGFREAISKYKKIQLIEETWFSEGKEDIAYAQTLDILKKHPDVAGIFGANEKTVIGIARAIEDLGLNGKIKLVGFDGNQEEVMFIEKGVIDAVMVQRPFNMGYLGVREAVEISLDKKKPEYIDTGAVLIRKDNLYTPENQKLLFPFVK